MQNLHAHTFFDDGQATPDAMVRASIEAGLSSVGLCCHSPINKQPTDWSIKEARIHDFIAGVYKAREQYRGQIDVYCGVELDVMSDPFLPLESFDYVIGAVHFLPLPMFSDISGKGKVAAHLLKHEEDFLYGEVDFLEEQLRGYIERIYKGDSMAACEAFYSQYVKIATNSRVDIVAHFDLLTKFDEPNDAKGNIFTRAKRSDFVFDIKNARYREAAMAALKILVEKDKIFEVNTGAVSRGYRETFYPEKSLLKEIYNQGGRITLSTDAHKPEHAGFMLKEAAEYAKSCGFKEIWNLKNGYFVPESL